LKTFKVRKLLLISNLVTSRATTTQQIMHIQMTESVAVPCVGH